MSMEGSPTRVFGQGVRPGAGQTECLLATKSEQGNPEDRLKQGNL